MTTIVIQPADDGRFWITVDDVEIPASAMTDVTWHLSAGVPMGYVTVGLAGHVTVVHTP